MAGFAGFETSEALLGVSVEEEAIEAGGAILFRGAQHTGHHTVEAQVNSEKRVYVLVVVLAGEAIFGGQLAAFAARVARETHFQVKLRESQRNLRGLARRSACPRVWVVLEFRFAHHAV